MRRRGRTDANHSAVIRELRQCGYSVMSLADLGDGAPDILVGGSIPRPSGPITYPFDDGRNNWIFEIKSPDQPPSAKRLTSAEKLWHENWRGQVAVIETAEQALEIMRKENG